MSVEIWDGDELLGLASERIVEYIDNQEARIKALESKPPWETTEACAEALREQLVARVEDAERITALSAMADELATWLKDPDLAIHLPPCQWWEPPGYAKGSGDCTCGLAALLARYYATKEDPDGQ